MTQEKIENTNRLVTIKKLGKLSKYLQKNVLENLLPTFKELPHDCIGKVGSGQLILHCYQKRYSKRKKFRCSHL